MQLKCPTHSLTISVGDAVGQLPVSVCVSFCKGVSTHEVHVLDRIYLLRLSCWNDKPPALLRECARKREAL